MTRPVEDVGDPVVHRAFVRDVHGGHVEAVGALAAIEGQRAAGAGAAEHRVAGAGESPREYGADAAGRAGDDRDPMSAVLSHHVLINHVLINYVLINHAVPLPSWSSPRRRPRRAAG